MLGHEIEEKAEASERAYRYYELQGIDPPDPYSEEFREVEYYYLEKIQKGE